MIGRPPISTLFPYTTLFRPERPDVDAIYMNAIMVQGEGGGWPLSAFCLPDGRPYFLGDRKSTRLNSSHANISYAVFCLKKKNIIANALLDRCIASCIIHTLN